MLNRSYIIYPVVLGLIISGCTIPRQGAFQSEMQSNRETISIQPINESITKINRRPYTEGFPQQMRSAPVVTMEKISSGDQLSISIIEGYNSSVPSSISGRLELARIDVLSDGSIFVPFAGRIQASGATVESIRQIIEYNLERKLYKPQVQVRLIESSSKSVSIFGAIKKGGSYPLSLNLLRLADLIGVAGLEVERPEQVRIEIRRNNRGFHINLRNLFLDPLDNIALQPGDVISVVKEAEYVTLMGAVSIPGKIEISGEKYSALDALAQARGLDEKNADPSGIYFFPVNNHGTSESKIVYSIDIRDPQQFLLAQQLYLKNGDLIYISTASFAQTIKIIDAISRILTPISFISNL